MEEEKEKNYVSLVVIMFINFNVIYFKLYKKL